MGKKKKKIKQIETRNEKKNSLKNTYLLLACFFGKCSHDFQMQIAFLSF